MESEVVMRPLSAEQYAKPKFRKAMAELSYPDNVRRLVELQRRLVPIYAMRGRIIVPWVLG